MLGKLSPLGHVEPKTLGRGDGGQCHRQLAAHPRRSIRCCGNRTAGGRCSSPRASARQLPAYWGPYAVSKAALEALVKTYAAETVTTPLRVNIVNPGPVRTRMRAQAMPGEDPLTCRHPKPSPKRCCRCSTPP